VAGVLLLVTFDELFPSFTIGLDTSFFIGAILTAAVGFYDDVRGVSFKSKFAAQVVIALFLIQAGYRIDLGWLIQSDPYNEVLYSAALTLLWIVGIMNAVNLIDGLDGLAGGVVLIAFLSLGAIFGLQGEMGLVAIAVVMIGALSAFLAFNFSPASIFMGDTGSLFLGYVVAAFSLSAPGHADPLIALIVPVVVLGLPVLDTTLSVVRRFSRGHSICAPDKDHLHHRLSAIWAPPKAVLMMYGAAAFFGVMGILMSLATPLGALIVIGLTLVITFSLVRRLGYEPMVIAEEIKRRFVEPQVQAIGPGEQTVAPKYVTVVPHRTRGRSRASSGDGMRGEEPTLISANGGEHPDRAPQRPESRHLGGAPKVEKNGREVERSLDLDTILELDKNVTPLNLNGESVLLCRQTGVRFGLNETGSSILGLLKENPRTVESIIDDLQEKYVADRGRIQRDVINFLGEASRRNLVRKVDSVATA